SDKATMDVPAPVGGVVKELLVSIGDRVSEGSAIIVLEATEGDAPAAAAAGSEAKEPAPAPESRTVAEEPRRAPAADPAPTARRPPPPAPISSAPLADARSVRAHASPAVRRFARELGVDLGLVRGSARKGLITREDVMAFPKAVMSGNRVF